MIRTKKVVMQLKTISAVGPSHVKIAGFIVKENSWKVF